MKMNVFAVTGIGLALVVGSIYLGVRIPITLPWGVWNLPVWAFICAVILYGAAVLPTPMFIQPTNYLAFYPAYAAIILLLVGALATPFTNIPVSMPAGPFLFDPQGILGPIWPILFVAIACGAISGWHSLVSSSSSSKQLDVETDALPVGGGAMLSEGLLALASLIAYMVLLPADFVGRNNVGAWVFGAVKLTSPFLGSLTVPVLTTFFGLVLIIYALTVQALVTRFFRLVAGETWGESRFRALGNKHVSSVVGLAIPWGFAVSGSWWALWLYFGGANQLLAGLAIMLITIHLARVRAPSRYSLIPGVFMVVTTLAALVWQTATFLYSVWAYLQNDKSWVLRNVRGPIQTDPNLLIIAVAINAIFVIVGAALFIVGISMAVRLFRSYSQSMADARAKAPAAADGGTIDKGSR
jgi:carbon starvation protein